jgi:hypothetical protein
MPVIPALGRWRQEDSKLEASLACIARLTLKNKSRNNNNKNLENLLCTRQLSEQYNHHSRFGQFQKTTLNTIIPKTEIWQDQLKLKTLKDENIILEKNLKIFTKRTYLKNTKHSRTLHRQLFIIK